MWVSTCQLRFSLCFPAIFTPFTCAQEMLLHRTNQDEDKVPTIFQIRSEIFLGFHPRTDINNTQWHILHKQNLKKCSDADAGLVLLFSASAFARNQGWNLKRLKNSADAAQARAGFSWTCFLHQLRRSTKVFYARPKLTMKIVQNEKLTKIIRNWMSFIYRLFWLIIAVIFSGLVLRKGFEQPSERWRHK